MKCISVDSMDKLWAKAYEQGSPAVSPLHREADFSGGCLSPFTMEYCSGVDTILWLHRRSPKTMLWRFHEGASHLNKHFKDTLPFMPRRYFTATLPCRKCAVCLRRRSSHWRYRAKYELAFASRTWFVTLTVNPVNRVRVDILVDRSTINTLSDDDRFCARHRVISKEITKFFKRLRKNTGAPIKYLLVAEQHKDGWPHYHALLHESTLPITKRAIQEEWVYGFSSAKLVGSDPRVAGYLLKYISKQALARIRASLRYGTSF